MAIRSGRRGVPFLAADDHGILRKSSRNAAWSEWGRVAQGAEFALLVAASAVWQRLKEVVAKNLFQRGRLEASVARLIFDPRDGGYLRRNRVADADHRVRAV